MMNIVALCLVFTSLTTAGLFSPKQPNYEREGHLLIVADKNDEPALLESKLNTETSGVLETAKEKFHKASSVLPNLGQGLSSELTQSESSSPICDAFGRCKDKITGAFSKAEESAREKTSEIGDSAREKTSQLGHKLGEVGEFAREKTSEMGHKIGEVGESTKKKASELGHKIGDSAKEKVGNQISESGEAVTEKSKKIAEGLSDWGKMLEETVGDERSLMKQKSTVLFSESGANITSLLRRSENNIYAAKQVASGEVLGPLLGVMHLLGFATAYGITVWVTFISSYVLAGALPRQQFGVVQSKIYPVYFKALVGCIGCCLVAHVFAHRRKLNGASGRAERLQAYNLLASLGMVLFNLLYLEPRASKVMFDRMKMEKEEGRGRTVEGEEVIEATITTAATTTTTSTTESGGRGVTATTVETSDVLTSSGRVAEQEGIRSRSAELNQRLKKLNSVSSLLNVVFLMSLTWHLVHLGQRLHVS